tara:strand:+ start:1119 stop:2912 length:1794 start_codon:yes stop_codon:yes gene_type:complete
MANSSLSVANLDFSDIKGNLKQYLQSQDLLKDYDFEGSNMNVMLDILSYNTYMQNFYLNMVAAEGFIDSAQLRDSVVSHAKTLNYLPGSHTASKAVIDFEILPANTPSSITVPKYTAFSTQVDSNTYSFTTNERITVSADTDGRYLVEDLEIFEGDIVYEYFTINSANTGQRFVLQNKEVDVNSLTVTVLTSATDTTNSIFTKSLTTIGLDGSSNVYFVVPAEDGKYELQFGDGVVGKKLINGNVVEAVYRKTAGDLPNGANSFTIGTADIAHDNTSITVTSTAKGGGIAESIDSIRVNAPRSITIQDRTVTVSDYKTLLLQNFNDIETLNVFGGEEATPPEFGKVIVSVDLKNADGIPDSRKKDIEDFLRLRSPLSVIPKVIDPEFLFVQVNSDVRYDPNRTSKSDLDIKTLVVDKIQEFANTNINKFDTTLRSSQLARSIDDADTSILNNDTFITLKKTINPDLGVANSFVLNFNNKIQQEIPDALNQYVDGSAPVQSTAFTFSNLTSCTLRDNGLGTLQIVRQANGDIQVVENNIGTVDYEEGVVSINTFEVSSFEGSAITVTTTPSNRTVKSNKNIILSYNQKPIINIIQERV